MSAPASRGSRGGEVPQSAASVRKLVGHLGVHPNRKLGQCFLADGEASSWICEQLEPGERDRIVEVGPGLGALTTYLLNGPHAHLIAIEKDARLAEHLSETLFADRSDAELIEGDAVAFDARPLFAEGGVLFVGNLPYAAGTEILRNFFDPPSPVHRGVIMVQKEVGERLAATPESRSYGALSLLVQAWWRVEILREFGPEYFHPKPEVDSVVLRLDPRQTGELPPFSGEAFRSLVRKGFAQRRKQLRKNLGVEREAWEALAKRLDFSPDVRAEALDLEQWVRLSDVLDDHPGKVAGFPGEEWFDVVDAQDHVMDRRLRPEVHAEGLLHRAVHILLVNRRGEVFLQQRSHLKDMHPGRWGSSASGHVDSGEDYDVAARREVEEELAVDPGEGLRFLAKLPASEETDQEFVGLYALAHRGRLRTHGSEVAAGGWFSIEMVRQWMEGRPDDFTPGFRACYRVFLDRFLKDSES